MITFFLLLWLIPIAANVWADANGRKPIYLVMFILRGMAAILHGVLFDPHTLQDYFPVFIFQVTSFWLLFEIALNIVRKKPILYYDTTEHDSGWIDKFFSLTGREFHFFCKLLALIILVFSIIIIYSR